MVVFPPLLTLILLALKPSQINFEGELRLLAASESKSLATRCEASVWSPATEVSPVPPEESSYLATHTEPLLVLRAPRGWRTLHYLSLGLADILAGGLVVLRHLISYTCT